MSWQTKKENMMAKQSKSTKTGLSVPVWLLILLVFLAGFALLINKAQQTPAVKNTKPAANANKTYKPKFPAVDPETFYKNQPKMSVEETKDKSKVAFDIKLPPDGTEGITGQLKVIQIQEKGIPGDIKGVGKISRIEMYFSKGFTVNQWYPTDAGEVKYIENYNIEDELKSKESQEDVKKGLIKKVTLNTVNAIGRRSYIEDEVFGEAYQMTAAVNWAKDSVWYSVSAVKPDKTLDEVIEVAKLFDQ